MVAVALPFNLALPFINEYLDFLRCRGEREGREQADNFGFKNACSGLRNGFCNAEGDKEEQAEAAS